MKIPTDEEIEDARVALEAAKSSPGCVSEATTHLAFPKMHRVKRAGEEYTRLVLLRDLAQSCESGTFVRQEWINTRLAETGRLYFSRSGVENIADSYPLAGFITAMSDLEAAMLRVDQSTQAISDTLAPDLAQRMCLLMQNVQIALLAVQNKITRA